MLDLFQTSEDFRVRLNNVLRTAGYSIDEMRYPEGYQEAPLAYDAVWSVALGNVELPPKGLSLLHLKLLS